MIVRLYGGKNWSWWLKLSTVLAVFSTCRGADFLVGEEDHRTGLALRLALVGCQGSCGIIPNGPVSSYPGSFNKCQGT